MKDVIRGGGTPASKGTRDRKARPQQYARELLFVVNMAYECTKQPNASQNSISALVRLLLIALREELEIKIDWIKRGKGRREGCGEYKATQCPGCGMEMAQVMPLFCNDFCKQRAAFVRYVRSCFSDQRITKEEILYEAIGSKLLMLFHGGYPEKERRLSDKLRKEIFERDKWLCECGKPATEIDHRNGNSNRPNDLRAVCRACNLAAMRAKIHRMEPIDAQKNPQLWLKMFDRREKILDEMMRPLAWRIAALSPIYASDSDEWENEWREIKKARHAIFEAMKESSTKHALHSPL